MVKKIIINLCYKLISLIDCKYNNAGEKIIWSNKLDDILVETDSGFKPTSYIHVTKPFYIYKIRTYDGFELNSADNHLVFDKHYNTISVADLNIGDTILTTNGCSKIKSISKLNHKISMCDLTIDSFEHRYYTNNILSHNTTSSALFMLHYALFNFDKNMLVLGNKRKTAIEILDKIKKIYLELPYFLKPGVYKWNESEVVFDNGCRIMAEATTINSGISFTFHCVLADEFAHIHPNILELFYNNLFPTITAGKARFMITSTQNGYNLFQQLYTAAENGESDYAPFKTDWWEVPEWNPDTRKWEKRDESWRLKQIANLGGSEEKFNAQFGTAFIADDKTLVSNRKLVELQENAIQYENKDLNGVLDSDCYWWLPNFEPMQDLRKSLLIITIDIGEGLGQDYTEISFNKYENDKIYNVGRYTSNKYNIYRVIESLDFLLNNYINRNTTIVSIEYNLYGELFYRELLTRIENNINNNNSNYDEDIIVKYYKDGKSIYSNGIRMNSSNKLRFCKLFKNSIENSNYINYDTRFVNQLLTFVEGGGSYRATVGCHDDCVMANIQLEAVKDTNAYKFLQESISFTNMGNDYDYNPYADEFYNTYLNE